MRVLLVNTYHYARGGDCTHVFALAEILRSHGHEVRFFGMRHPDNLACDDERYWVDYIDFVELNGHKTLGSAAKVMGRVIYSPQSRRRLEEMLDTWRPDVAHLHNIHGHLSLSILDTFRERGIPTIWTLHDYRLICPNTSLLSGDRVCEECKGDRFWKCTTNRCKKGSYAASLVATFEASAQRTLGIAKNVDMFIAPSEFLRSKFAEFGWPIERMVAMHNYLPHMPELTPLAEQGPALYVGQLQECKGVDWLLRAIALAPELEIDIVGDGPQRARLEALASGLGVADRVRFRGRVLPDEVAGFQARCAFVVVPSRWYENCPYSVLEALGQGRAVIAASIGGLPELVTDGQNGCLVDVGDTEGLASAMRRLHEDSELLRRLSAGARESAARFGPEDYYVALTGIYQSAIKRHSVGAPAR